MDERRARGYMGLSVRAGKAVFGEEGCLKSVRGRTCACLLVDISASANTLDRYRSACAHAGIPLFLLPEDLIFQATGRPGKAMALRPGGLADQLIGLLSQAEKEDQIGGASDTWRTSN